jgi:hypothetical protein
LLLKLKEDNLPLFLIVDDGSQCYVIDNQVIGVQIGGWYGQYPFNPYYQINRIFNAPVTQKFLPKTLQKYLSESYTLPYQPLFRHLSGYCDDYVHHIVNLDLEISDDKTQPISLKIIHYQNHERNRFFGPINLTLKEAFLLFSNILANSRCTNYGFYDTTSELSIETHPNAFHDVHFNYFKADYIRLVNYSHFYMHYLKNELLTGSLTPYEVAFYGGTTLLTHLASIKPVEDFVFQAIKDITKPTDISRNQSIIYYCFLLEISRSLYLDSKFNLSGIQLLEDFLAFLPERFPTGSD